MCCRGWLTAKRLAPADCRRHPLLARKQWLADHLQLAGRLVLDEGAAHAVVHKGTSLLPIGVVAVEESSCAAKRWPASIRKATKWRAGWSTTARTKPG